MPVIRLTTADVLRSIVCLLDESFGEPSDSHPHDPNPHNSAGAVLVRLEQMPTDLDEAFDLGLKHLEPGMHPLALLDGFIAPAGWAALGVMAEGRVYRVDDPEAPPGRGRATAVVARDGTRVSALRLPGRALEVDVSEPTQPVMGDIPLALCRALGVPVVVGAGP
jgi:hypothetical protein